ncbi:dTDP-4-dehydrorhamnose reductase [Profundibacter sp.]|uniref:dTDP-4-dehydrorhamnose reductase n=1 Tax=Profundibacter sp. TaxID=3101071 RepID=UPI003D0D3101
MRILVFGKTGQVATELARQAGVVNLGRDQADLFDPVACAAIIRETDADAVINAAAFTAVDRAEDEEELATLINGTAPTAMAKAAAKRGLTFLHISSDYVFNGQGERPWQPDDTPSPLGAYGRSKLAGEDGVRTAGGAYAILRTSWVFSAHRGNFVKTMLQLGKTHNSLDIVSDQIGGPTPAAGIATTLLTMAKAFHNGSGRSGIYHYSGTPEISWAGFARQIYARSGMKVAVRDIPTSAYPTPAKRPLNSRLNASTLAADYGIDPPNWQAGLNDVLKELGQLKNG